MGIYEHERINIYSKCWDMASPHNWMGPKKMGKGHLYNFNHGFDFLDPTNNMELLCLMNY